MVKTKEQKATDILKTMRNVEDIRLRYDGILVYPSGVEHYLGGFFKSEQAARNAAARTRARLRACNIPVKSIHTAVIECRPTGKSSDLSGIYPSDYGTKDFPVSAYFKK